VTRALLAWGPPVAWAGVLFLLSEWSSVPRSTWAALNDKVVHLALYAVLGASLAWGKRVGSEDPPHWALLLLGAGYGAVDEWHQNFVPRRHPSVADWFADVVGLLVGYLLVLGLWSLWKRSTSDLRSAPRGDAGR